MRRIDKLDRAQRVVVVVALGAAFLALGSYLLSMGQPGIPSGWAAPFAVGGGFMPSGFGLRGLVNLIVWLVLTAVWAVLSIRLLRPSGQDQSGSSSPEGPAAP